MRAPAFTFATPTEKQITSPSDPWEPNLRFLKQHLHRGGRLTAGQALWIISSGAQALREEPDPLDTPIMVRSDVPGYNSRLLELVHKFSSLRPSEPYIHAPLGGHDVSTFPDTWAAGNFISLSYARRRRLSVDWKSSSHIKIGTGKVVKTLGTTSLPFIFLGEEAAYELVFNVIPTSVHDIIIGSHFLRLTETFT